MKIPESVLDLLCEIFRMVLMVDCSIAGDVASASDGMISVKAWLALEISSAFRIGELSRCCSIILTAACSSAKFSSGLLRESFVSSSSVEFSVESGGDMTAPAGICVSSLTGGGDCRRLPEANIKFDSSFSLSAVPGGVGSSDVGAKVGDLREVVRRCLFKYEVDLGSSGLWEPFDDVLD